MSFSPDSRWLCSFGNIHDGFVHVWSISSRLAKPRLFASNKCISLVRDTAWMGNTIVSVGTRHVKLWRVEESTSTSPVKIGTDTSRNGDWSSYPQGTKVLQGRNCILGSMVDACFTSVTAVSEDKAVLGTVEGDLCLLCGSGDSPILKRIHSFPFEITAIAIDERRQTVAVGGKRRNFVTLPLEHLISGNPPSTKIMDTRTESDAVAMGYLGSTLVFIGSNRAIVIDPQAAHNVNGNLSTMALGERGINGCLERAVTETAIPSEKIGHIESTKHHTQALVEASHLSGHATSVLGVHMLQNRERYSSDFLTYSTDGAIKFWNIEGRQRHQLKVNLSEIVDENDNEPNELRILKASSSAETLVYGDRMGNVALLESDSGAVKVHSSEVTAITLARPEAGPEIIATCGRDRTIQVFRKQGLTLSLVQTVTGEHVGAVNCIAFYKNGSCLVSASTDRTIILRSAVFGNDEKVAYIQTKVINLKASPLTACVGTDALSGLIVSTMDRQVLRYDLEAGQILESFKTADGLGSTDSVILNVCKVLQIGKASDHRMSLIIGASSTDKSIRLYDPGNGALLAREHGQTSISDIGVLEKTDGNGTTTCRVVTTGLDGTIYIWRLEYPSSCINGTQADDGANDPIRNTQPLRKVLSKTELRELQRSLETTSAPTTPTQRINSPTRLKKKPSRLGLSHTPRQTLPVIPSMGHKKAPTIQSNIHSPSATSPRTGRAARSRRSSIESGHSAKDLAYPSLEIINIAEGLCASLRVFRSQLEGSSGKLPYSTRIDLLHEMNQVISTVTHGEIDDERVLRKEGSADSSFDDYVSRMIDQRLALRRDSSSQDHESVVNNAKPMETTNPTTSGLKGNG